VKLPRDLSGADLAKALSKVGYAISRQTGSHIRLTADFPRRHHVTIPAHESLRVGTLSRIIGEVAAHGQIDREVLLKQLFDWIRDEPTEEWIVNPRRDRTCPDESPDIRTAA
jgi:predicted RNA binding protein YcfA (HicA-like mRNA interferase family)